MSSVSQWYSGKHILVTGATGFMGKVLVEKLLRSCQDISKIYVLVREKRGRTSTQRGEDILNSPVFDKLRDLPNGTQLLQKLHCVCGDVTQPDLNLSIDDRQLLQDNVSVVFHMAANVRFDQALKSALLMNTGGTLRVLELAQSCRNLKAFVHVSTSYCHCKELVLEERMYEAPQDPRKMLDLVGWMGDDLIKLLTPALLEQYPNTYAYTKCLTEQLVGEYSKKMPIAIVRPSIVIAANKEPMPGWVENLNGPTGLLVGGGKGVIRSMLCDSSLAADLVPVDVSINALIVIAKEVGEGGLREEPMVFNLTADTTNPITWGEALDIGRTHFYDNPFSICLWYPGGTIKTSYVMHMLAVFFLHMVPAYVIDFMLMMLGKKPFLVRVQKRIQSGLVVLQYYTMRSWIFVHENVKGIAAKLGPEDREIFTTDTSQLDWNKYLLNYVLGARRYCVHEEPETLPRAKKLLKRLYYLDLATKSLFGCLLLWLIYAYSSAFFSTGEYFVSYLSISATK